MVTTTQGRALQGIKSAIQLVRYKPANFAAFAYLLPWLAFLEILQSPKICSVLEDSVIMVAMTESSPA
jgi:hypothetical protein